MDYSEELVRLSDIDRDDDLFSVTYGRPLDALFRSIAAIGLQRPIILQRKGGGRFRIVSGSRRLQVLEKMGKRTLKAAIVSEKVASSNLFLFSFFDHIDRGFNVVEQALAVKGLCLFLEEEKVIREFLPFMKLLPQKEVLRRLLTVAEMSPAFRPALLEGRLFPEILETIRKEFPGLKHFLPALFIFLHFSFQKQREFLLDLKESGIRRHEAAEMVLDSPSFRKILLDPALNAVQKGETVRKALRTILFPVLCQNEDRFRAVVAEGTWDERTRLIPPPYFEGGEYLVQIRFSHPRELKASLKKIEQLVAEGKLDGLP